MIPLPPKHHRLYALCVPPAVRGRWAAAAGRVHHVWACVFSSPTIQLSPKIQSQIIICNSISQSPLFRRWRGSLVRTCESSVAWQSCSSHQQRDPSSRSAYAIIVIIKARHADGACWINYAAHPPFLLPARGTRGWFLGHGGDCVFIMARYNVTAGEI